MLALALVLTVASHVVGQTSKPVLSAADVLGDYIGMVRLQSAPYPSGGDIVYGRAFTFVEEPDGLYIFTGTWAGLTNTTQTQINKWKLPWNGSTLTAPQATFAAVMGTVPVRGTLFALKWDPLERLLYANGTNDYDGDFAINKTLSINLIDPTTGKFATRGHFAFATRSDKTTAGAMTPLPLWFQSLTGCGPWLATGGGYFSVDTSGPNSRGPAATCITGPMVDAATPIANRSVLNYPLSSVPGTPFAQRSTNYTQVFHWDWTPERPQGTGYFTPGDDVWPGGVFIDTSTHAALAYVVGLQRGCIFYGDNCPLATRKKPLVSEGPFVSPLATDVATSIVTMPVSVTWPSGTMVRLSDLGTAGCPAVTTCTRCTTGLNGKSIGYWAYFVRREPSGAYTFHVTQAASLDPASVPIPLASAVTGGIQPVSFCATFAGKDAALNSEGLEHWLYLYDPADLIAVATGQKAPNAIQAASMTKLVLPGVPETSGMPDNWYHVIGVDYLPTQRLFGVLVRNVSSFSGRPLLFLWRVRDTPIAQPLSAPTHGRAVEAS